MIETWRVNQVDGERPINVLELYDHLARSHGHGGSYKSVLHYVRARWGRPPIRASLRFIGRCRYAGAWSLCGWSK